MEGRTSHQYDSESLDLRLRRLADYEIIEIDAEWRSAISLIREVVRLIQYNADVRARLAYEVGGLNQLSDLVDELLSGETMIRSREEAYDCMDDGQQPSTLDELWTFLPPIAELEELVVFEEYIPSEIDHLASVSERKSEIARRLIDLRVQEAAVVAR